MRATTTPENLQSHSTTPSNQTPIYTPAPTSPSLSAWGFDEKPPLKTIPNFSTLTYSTPRPGSKYHIQSSSTQNFLTWENSKVVLRPIPLHDSLPLTQWSCMRSPNGRLGFQDAHSGLFLGYDESFELCCQARKHDLWEYFEIEHKGDERYHLLMTYYKFWFTLPFKNRLLPVGIKEGVFSGDERMVVMEEWNKEGSLWRFIEV